MADEEKVVLSLEGKQSATADIDKVVASLANLDSKGVAVAAGLTAGFVAVGAAMVGLGVKAYQLGDSFDSMWDKIRIGTGATGERLEGLQNTARNVASNVASDFDNIGTAIAGLNARTGQTGDGLEALASNVLNLTRLTGEGLNETIRGSTRLFGDWGIAAEDQVGALDKLFRAHQVTGIEVSKLMDLMVQFGGPLRLLGFSFDEAAATMSKWEREGVNLELVMGGLKVGVADMARAGVPLREGLEGLIQTIRDAEDPTDALSIAMEVFGSRAGPDMAAAIREGRFELGTLIDDIEDSDGAIAASTADTEDAAEKWQKALNNIALAFEPVGEATLTMATEIAEQLGPAIQWLTTDVLPAGGAALHAFGDAAGWAGGKLGELVGMAVAAGQAIDGAINKILQLTGVQHAALTAAPSQGNLPIGVASAQLDRQLGVATGNQPGSVYQPPIGPPMPTLGPFQSEIIDEGGGGGGGPSRPSLGSGSTGAAFDAYLKGIRDKIAAARGGGGGGGKGGGGGGGGGGIKEAARTALDGFDEAVAEWARDQSYITAFGDVGAKAATALAKAVADGTEQSGKALQTAERDLVALLQKAGVPEWENLAEITRGAFRAALEKRDQASIDAAMDWMGELTEHLKEAGYFFGGLTADSFLAGFQRAQLGDKMGSAGNAVIDAFDAAVKDGSEKNVRSVSDAVFKLVRQVNQDLPADQAADWTSQAMDAVFALIQERTPEARARVREVFEAMSFQVPLQKLGNEMADRVNKAIDAAIEAITEVKKHQQESFDEAVKNLALDRDTRTQRDAFGMGQRNDLNERNSSVSRARDERRIAAAEAREDEARLNKIKDDDHERDLARIKQLRDVRRANQPQGVEQLGTAGGMSIVNRGTAGPIDELHRQWKEQDAETERLRAKDKANTDAARRVATQQREADRQEARADAIDDQQFADAQAVSRQAFEDRLSDEAFGRRWEAGGTEEKATAKAIAEINKRLGEQEDAEQKRYDDAVTKQLQLTALADDWYAGALADIKEIQGIQTAMDTGDKATPDSKPNPNNGLPAAGGKGDFGGVGGGATTVGAGAGGSWGGAGGWGGSSGSGSGGGGGPSADSVSVTVNNPVIVGGQNAEQGALAIAGSLSGLAAIARLIGH